ncbi:YolD-like family protein [Macrococcus brunensis]|uniref:YolD-like family protein n=1 Tax=Macrococcus brunensis TaxID=198483 RepID=UPI001EF09136|nr:YolD-like family protein [Macrococcus brunensis]ULG70892.1 YolD-like family protein [Macrococcus brunensis]
MNPLNPNLPKEYEYETDYRNIPQHLLNKNIPKGRGMIKWAPFATMPEQFRNIAQMIENQSKVEKPMLSDDQLIELDVMLTKYMSLPSSCTIRIYEFGYINDYECIVESVDHIERTVAVYDCDTHLRVTFELDHIIGINA